MDKRYSTILKMIDELDADYKRQRIVLERGMELAIEKINPMVIACARKITIYEAWDHEREKIPFRDLRAHLILWIPGQHKDTLRSPLLERVCMWKKQHSILGFQGKDWVVEEWKHTLDTLPGYWYYASSIAIRFYFPISSPPRLPSTCRIETVHEQRNLNSEITRIVCNLDS